MVLKEYHRLVNSMEFACCNAVALSDCFTGVVKYLRSPEFGNICKNLMKMLDRIAWFYGLNNMGKL